MDEYNITKLCDRLGLSYSRGYSGSRRGPHISISCPLASPPTKTLPNGGYHQHYYDDNMSCSVKIVENGPSLVRCHSAKCGFKGSLLSLIRLYSEMHGNNADLKKLVTEVADKEKLTLDGILDRISRKIKVAGLPDKRDPEIIDERRLDPFRGSVPGYIKNRGITLDTCRRWGLGYDRDKKRLVFPVRRLDGSLIGITGRDITGNSSRKYHNYSGLDKVKYIYGSHLLEDNKPIVIVEGPIDAVLTDQYLYPKCCTVATLGEGFSEYHVKTIASKCPPFVCIFTDGDPAGKDMADRINYSLMDQHFVRKVIKTPNGMDPASLNREAVNELFDESEIVYGKYTNY